jgi:predicted nucleotidyltransferase
MLNLLVKSAVRRKVVGLFALNPEEELYSGQVAKEIDESPHAVGLELAYLVEGGPLRTIERGRHIYYQWNPSYPYAAILKQVAEKMRREGNEEMRDLPDLAQRRRIAENLKRIVDDIKKYFDPEKIIVFGTAATGKVGPDSDIDMVVIRRTTTPFFRRGADMAVQLEYDVGLDLLVYTPEEFRSAVKERRFFRDEIVKRGKVLYDKAA